MAENGWYYVSETNRIGPVKRSEIDQLIGTGHIRNTTLVWRDGLEGWEPASSHFSASKVSSPPPIPALPPPVGTSQSPSQVNNNKIDYSGVYLGAPPRNFVEAITTCMGKYITFSGRASRSEYWYFTLFCFLVGIICAILDGGFGAGTVYRQQQDMFQGIATLVLFFPSLAATFRRLHDTDRSGWWIGWYWIAIVAFSAILGSTVNNGAVGRYPSSMGALITMLGFGFLAYSIAIFAFLCQRGTFRPNRHG